jgi:hypothetical protein
MVEIKNSTALTDLFGHWPDFHDAELHHVRVDTTNHRDPCLEIEFEVAEMSAEVDERGYYKDRCRVRTVLRFENVGSLRLEGVYSQNVLSELLIQSAGPTDFDEVLGADDPRARRQHRVDWSSAIGMTGRFICDRIAVLSAKPCVRAS